MTYKSVLLAIKFIQNTANNSFQIEPGDSLKNENFTFKQWNIASFFFFSLTFCRQIPIFTELVIILGFDHIPDNYFSFFTVRQYKYPKYRTDDVNSYNTRLHTIYIPITHKNVDFAT